MAVSQVNGISADVKRAAEAAAPITVEKTRMILPPKGPIPNRGSSLPDHVAIGPDSESKVEWQRRKGIDRSKQARIVKVSHMRYQHPDLPVITQFLRDFGLHVAAHTDNQIWFRGYGPDQYVYYAQQGPKRFLGGSFEVESRGELEKILRIPDVKVLSDEIEEMKDAPGGGLLLTIEDPEGFPLNFICDQAPLSEERLSKITKPQKLMVNDEAEKPRKKAFQRFDPGPAEVFKLGHFGCVVDNFEGAMEWYTRYFNIIPSDLLYVPVPSQDGKTSTRKEVAMFAHIDRGQDLVDHHTLFLTSKPPNIDPHVHHCSFEVHDFDTQALGHQWLAKKNYDSVWGVGRHILGSQIFDYWWDVNGFMVEHYADGDLVNEDTPLGYGPAGFEGLAVWGPEVPQAFLD